MAEDVDEIIRIAAQQSAQMLLDHIDLQIFVAETGMTLPGKNEYQISRLRTAIYNLNFFREWITTTLLSSNNPIYIVEISSLINKTLFSVASIAREVDKKTMDRLKLSKQLETVRSSSMKARQKSVIDVIVPDILRSDMKKGRTLSGSTNAIANRILPDVNLALAAQGLTKLRGTSAVRERVDLFRFENGLA